MRLHLVELDGLYNCLLHNGHNGSNRLMMGWMLLNPGLLARGTLQMSKRSLLRKMTTTRKYHEIDPYRICRDTEMREKEKESVFIRIL